MTCQVCTKPSGRYPICRDCHKERESGIVAKCAVCLRWSRVEHGLCGPCGKLEVVVGPAIITGWAKRTYANAMAGADLRDGPDRRSLSEAKRVAEEIYETIGGREARGPARIKAPILLRWGNGLSDIANGGLARMSAGALAPKYSALASVAAELESALREAGTSAGPSSPVPAGGELVRLVDQKTTLLTDRHIPRAVTRLIAEAKEELLIVSPWIAGVDSLVEQLVGSSKGVRIRIVTRKPEAGDDEHRRTLHLLNHPGLDFQFSRHVHAKMIIRDGQEAIIGSANLVSTSLDRNQEAAVLTTEENVVTDAIGYFNEIYRRARAEMIGR